MTAHQPFFPHYGSGLNVTSTATSQSGLIPVGNGKQMRVLNKGANELYIRTFNSLTGGTSGTATTADYNIQPGQSSTISRIGHDSFAHISPAGTTFNLIPGEGF